MRFLTSPSLLPTLSILLNAAASLRYFAARDPGRGVYWLAATLITLSVTFWIKD